MRMDAPFEVIVGRIETLALDAIVNAANRQLAPGTGVDGAIRAAAGAELTEHTSKLAPLDDGGVVLTPGFALPARHIIHTAAPVWSEGEEGAKVAGLARCYMGAIKLAHEHALASIAFPCLGTGNFGWPRGFACAIAIASCEQALTEAAGVTRVVFCCFTEADAELYRKGFG
ncbi:MAG: macro domain-containing protein [Hyphomonadaceae bacterium]|nr:macro domain-containing protein [Hyphomonadaceae bacterium]